MPTEINTKPLGILAGEGDLPISLAHYCLANAIPVCVVQFDGCRYDRDDWPDTPKLKTRIEKVGQIFKFFHHHHVQNVVMIGNLQRPPLTSLRPDYRGIKTLGRIAKAIVSGGDDTLLKTLRREIEAEGFTVVGIDYYLRDLTVRAGVLTIMQSQHPHDAAIKIAIQHGIEDKGQSILAHTDGTYTLEDHNGTTALINTYGRTGSFLIKMMKPQQDPDLDRPTVGLQTLQALKQAGCAGMIIQADGVFLVDKEKMIDYANANHLVIESVHA